MGVMAKSVVSVRGKTLYDACSAPIALVQRLSCLFSGGHTNLS